MKINGNDCSINSKILTGLDVPLARVPTQHTHTRRATFAAHAGVRSRSLHATADTRVAGERPGGRGTGTGRYTMPASSSSEGVAYPQRAIQLPPDVDALPPSNANVTLRQIVDVSTEEMSCQIPLWT